MKSSLRRKARRIVQLLEAVYGSPRHGNKDDPLDELMFIILSQMTTGPSFNRVYDRLKSEYPRWGSLLGIPVSKLKSLIMDAGLSGQKAPRMQAILRRLKDDFGAVTLVPLKCMSDTDAEKYLTTLPGVGIKTAKCVLMYSLGREVLPLDTHVWRIMNRTGLIAQKSNSKVAHAAAEGVVRPADRYSLHVNGVAHGRSVCLAIRPRCGFCQLRRHCKFKNESKATLLRPRPEKA